MKIEAYAQKYAPMIAPFLNLTLKKYSKSLQEDRIRKYLALSVLGKKLEVVTLNDIKKVKSENKLRWLLINDDTKRYYSNNSLLSHLEQ